MFMNFDAILPPRPTIWDIYRAVAKPRPLVAVEAADADEAIQKAAKEFMRKSCRGRVECEYPRIFYDH
jgi:hypothetical protein